MDRYLAGEGKSDLCLRSGLWDADIRAILESHGVHVRTHKEAAALAGEKTRERNTRRKARRRGE